MLISLTVKQFALIEHVHLELNAGMTAFTGETGAGKSMLGDALGAVFGARASAGLVRHGADKAEVTALWHGDDERIHALLESSDIDIDDDLILRRVITAEGRSRSYINGVPVNLKMLRQIGDICLDMHGQHEHQSLMQPAVQRQLLDALVPAELLSDCADAYKQWRQYRARLQALHAEHSETAQQADWMRGELARLDELEIEPGLPESLQREVDAGRHHARIQQAAAEAMMWLDEGEPSVRSLIAHAGRALADAADVHDGLQRSLVLIEQIDALLGEATPELRDALDRSFDEAALNRAEQRLLSLHEAMRRHDCADENALLTLMERWREQLTTLDTAGWDEASLQQTLDQAAGRYRDCAEALSRARAQAADALVAQLRPFLDKLALGGMQVKFAVDAHPDEAGWSASGWDNIVIHIMSNPGEPWRELAAVASGGELSRLVLAFKGCGAMRDMPALAVFDEVDTGIGGETAWCVGEMLARMGRDRQVLVISHLPQVAACADQQVVISKSTRDGRTLTALESVEADARRAEIARMLGSGAGDQSLEHAAAMLEHGRSVATDA